MCIRDRATGALSDAAAARADVTRDQVTRQVVSTYFNYSACLLYTSDAADERSSVDLGGRRIINKKNRRVMHRTRLTET